MPKSTRVTDSTETSLDNTNPTGSRSRMNRAFFIAALAAAVPSFATSLGVPDLKAVWGTSPTDVWAVGLTDPDTVGSTGLYHYDGETWTPGVMSAELTSLIFPGAPSDILEFRTVAGNASNNVYAVVARYDDEARFTVWFNGTEWVKHASLSSDKYISSYVDPTNGDVYIGGRAFSGGGSIIRRALGGTGMEGQAGIAFAQIFSSSAYGFGVTNIAGLPENPTAAYPTEIFFATTNGMFHFNSPEDGTSTGIVRPLINGWGSYALPAVGVFSTKNETGDPSVLVANENGVTSFTWNGTILTANGDSGVAPSFSLGNAGSTIRVAAYHSTMEGGGQGELDNVFALQNVNDQGAVLKYNFGTMTWETIGAASVPLRDMIVFPNGIYFAVGDDGEVVTNHAPGSDEYVWDNSVEAQGDHSFHGSTGGPTNWFIGNTNTRHDTIEAGGKFHINNGAVTLSSQSVDAESIDASGSLLVENTLTLGASSSSIQDLSLHDDLSVGGTLTLAGDNNLWAAGILSGAGTVTSNGTLIMNPSSGTQTMDPNGMLDLFTTLEIAGSGTATFAAGILDLGTMGHFDVLSGGNFNFSTLTITDSGAPASVSNGGTMTKSGAGDSTFDTSSFTNEDASTLKVEAGTLYFIGAGRFAGVLDNAAGAMTVFDGASIAMGDIGGQPFFIRGAGDVHLTSTMVEVTTGAETTIYNSGDTGGVFVGPGVDFTGDGTLRILDTGFLKYAGIGTDEFDGTVYLHGRLHMQSGTLQLNGAVEATGQFLVDGGELRLSAPLGKANVFDGVHFEILAPGELVLEANETTVTSDVDLHGDGDVMLGDGSTFYVGDGFTPTVFSNRLTASTLELGGASLIGPADDTIARFQNEERLTLDRGALTDLLLVNDPADPVIGVLKIASNPLAPTEDVWTENVSITNEIDGLVQQSASITATSGPLRITNHGRYEIDGADLTPVSGLVTFNNEYTGGSGGVLDFTGQSTLDGDFTNNGTVIVNPGANVIIGNSMDPSGSVPQGIAVTMGTWDVRNGTLRRGSWVGGNWVFAPLLQIGATSAVRLAGAQASFNPPSAPAALELPFELFGHLLLESHAFVAPFGPTAVVPTGDSVHVGFSVASAGLLELKEATVELQNDSFLWNKGTIKGSGEIHGGVFSSGEIDDTVTIVPGMSPGTLGISGTFYNGQSSTVEIEIGGLEAGYDYDQLVVGGAATFAAGSKIRVTLIDANPNDDDDGPFVPRTGDEFTIQISDGLTLPSGTSLADFVEFANLPAEVTLTPQLVDVNGKTSLVLSTNSTLTPPAGARITSHPKATTTTAGDTTTLSVSVDAATNVTYQWQLNGVNIPGAAGSTFTLPSTQFLHAGDYTVVVTADGVSTTSRSAALVVDEPPPSTSRLVNISTRAIAGSGESTLVLGFYIAGTGSKTLVIRAVGPELGLAPFNLKNVVSDPSLVIYKGQTVIDSNEDWDASLAADFSAVGAFPLTNGSNDAALKVTLAPGGYTVHLVNPGPLAQGLIEIYDYSKDAGTRLANLSTRLLLGQGETIIVGTYVENDPVPLPLVIRNVGPGLGTLGLVGYHPDPRLRIYSGSTDIGFNDDWDPTLATRFAEVGAFGLETDSKDAAARVALKKGGYTIHATGAGEGVVIVELYENR